MLLLLGCDELRQLSLYLFHVGAAGSLWKDEASGPSARAENPVAAEVCLGLQGGPIKCVGQAMSDRWLDCSEL